MGVIFIMCTEDTKSKSFTTHVGRCEDGREKTVEENGGKIERGEAAWLLKRHPAQCGWSGESRQKEKQHGKSRKISIMIMN